MLRRISLGSLGLVVGGCLAFMGLVAYLLDKPTLNLAGFFYGVPLLLGGLALKAAELKPIPFSQPTPPEIISLREQQATPTQNQIRQDVTRYRYGQEAHLDESLERLGLRPTDEERPVLKALQETETAGAYTLIMEFDSPFITMERWEQKQEKIAKFFGPGIRVEVNQPEENFVKVALIAISGETS